MLAESQKSKDEDQAVKRRYVSGSKPYSFIHSLTECVLKTYYVPSTVLGSVDVKWNETWSVFQRC